MQRTEIIRLIQQLGHKIIPDGSRLLLYGSQARGDYKEYSDWDLLLILNKDKETADDFMKFAYPIIELGLNLGLMFSVQTYTRNDWEKYRATPFFCNVENDKIILI